MARIDSAPVTELIGTVKVQTAKAVLFVFEDDDEIKREEWFPMSQIKSMEETIDGTVLTVTVWIYEQKEKSWKDKK